MKRKIILTVLFLSLIYLTFSNEKSAPIPTDSNRFTFTVSGINNQLMSYSEMSTGNKLLGAAIGFTVSDSLCLILGITGAAILGVSFNLVFATQTVADTMLYTGIAMTALFFTFFALLLPGVILFWVLYSMYKDPTAGILDISNNAIALRFRL
jgi:hypothetical protein